MKLKVIVTDIRPVNSLSVNRSLPVMTGFPSCQVFLMVLPSAFLKTIVELKAIFQLLSKEYFSDILVYYLRKVPQNIAELKNIDLNMTLLDWQSFFIL